MLELHTLGVDGGYTQKDVTEVARCFTGWTIKNPQGGSTFTYNDRVHDKGEKTVLGVTIPAGGGREDGEKVLDILAKHPSTARFISKKLAQRFVADNPPQTLIDRMAKTFLSTDGDIRAVLNTMFTSKEFMSQGAYQAKVKTPFEMIVSSVRATGARGRLRVSSGQPHRATGPASVPQAGADRLFQRQRRVDQLRIAAGADEFRSGPDAEQSAGHQGGPGAL